MTRDPSNRSVILISISSDIGSAMAKRYIKRGWSVYGTFRNESNITRDLNKAGVVLIPCDLSDSESIRKACRELRRKCPRWDSLIVCAGALEPVGPLMDCDFSEWEESIQVNFTSQIHIVRELLQTRNTKSTNRPIVLFFAGGGTNNATINYSAYTVSKIALIKMCELLDAEIPDTRFAIVGPGWVKTRIHQATLDAGEKAGENFERTKQMLMGDGCTEMAKVLDCFDWLMNTPGKAVSGRNFSVVYDPWGTVELTQRLMEDFNMYKLRRKGNEAIPSNTGKKEGQLPQPASNNLIENLFLSLPRITAHHGPDTPLHLALKQAARREVEGLFSTQDPRAIPFKPFGELTFPFTQLGENVTSLNLFDLDELIIFSFYWANRKRYKRVLDLGANIGLHSIILNKCGFEVRSYEPDPYHFELLQRNLGLNSCKKVKPFNMAISSKEGVLEFVRVLGNTTGSHLSGAKANPYGDLDRFPVKVEGIKNIIGWADLVKMDIEGQERETLLVTSRKHWEHTDALVEIENERNAADILKHFKSIGVGLFSQKNNWRKVRSLKDMPKSYHDGTLFISCKSSMPWNEG